jgi:glucosamine--fructose-6-phosphate aminotransferase (isomerizing)
MASEFRYRDPIVTESTLVIALSQSGETADTLAAVRIARSKGARVFAITNCVGSQITRESDGTLYVKANMEISVAATKSFLAQIACLALIAMLLGQKRHLLTTRQVKQLYYDLRQTPAQIEDILQDTDVIEQAAKVIAKAHSVMYVGRGMGSTVCHEGALKLKEISYLHAEAYPAGELKHGPIALLDEEVPVVAVVTKSPTRAQTLSNIAEIRARHSRVIAVATEGDEEVADVADFVFYIPPVRDWCSAITASVPLQLLARYVAVERGCDVDHPRNLAKSVTVE